jgi:hypothetical protein
MRNLHPIITMSSEGHIMQLHDITGELIHMTVAGEYNSYES